MMRSLVAIIAGLCLALTAAQSAAADSRNYQLTLVAKDGATQAIGRLVLTPQEDQRWALKVTLDETQFVDEFLNMAPFQCLYLGNNGLCHLRYTYPLRRQISPTDLVDLDYSLLFIQRPKDQYGIDPYNGRYFQFAWEGDELVGSLREVDMNLLIAPPQEGEYRPIKEFDLHDADLGRNYFVELRATPAD